VTGLYKDRLHSLGAWMKRLKTKLFAKAKLDDTASGHLPAEDMKELEVHYCRKCSNGGKCFQEDDDDDAKATDDVKEDNTW
jgi:hypothetical protein